MFCWSVEEFTTKKKGEGGRVNVRVARCVEEVRQERAKNTSARLCHREECKIKREEKKESQCNF